MLLRRITEHVKAQNWTAVALDFVIVVVGVFIGIQVSNWNDARAQRAEEAIILSQIRTSVQSDLASVERELQRFQRIEAALSKLLVHIENKKAYDPALDASFGLMYGFGYLNLDRAAYESLKSEGVGLVRDEFLRADISSLYEKTYQQLDKAMAGEANVVLFMRPFFIENFRDLDFTRSATPIDYDRLIDDVRLRNLTDYRLQTVRVNQLKHLGEGREEMASLIVSLDRALEN